MKGANAAYSPVILLPPNYKVLDLSTGAPFEKPKEEYWVGKYDENRPNLYNDDLFDNKRTLHIGIDIGAPVGTPCMAFADGEISHFGYNPAAGDYGHVVITKHVVDDAPIWALYGHLTATSIQGKLVGHKVSKGEVLCWVGAHHENGGWTPHLHFQLSRSPPTSHDMPGVVAPQDREAALCVYPDPRLVLGPLY